MAGAKNITVIPARKRVGNIVTAEDKPKLKVAAYCRVSTDSEEQATSYDAQVEHYTEFIRKNPEWEFAGIYADDGISGTNTKKREEFNRMIEDTMAGKIDMIITKSISRFARNTLDCLKYIRQLKEKNVPVFFEKENINTLDAKGEVLLTIMASLAQQESESLSKNVKMGLQFRYQNGEVQVNHNWFLGYTKDENGHLIIDEDQAVVVRRIFREYLQGASLKQLQTDLWQTAYLQQPEIRNGVGMASERYLQTRSTWVMPFCRRPIRLMFLLRNEYPITALFHSTMLRITTKQSFQDSCSCKFRKNSFVEHTLKLKTERPRESTVASTHYRVLSTVASVETFQKSGLEGQGCIIQQMEMCQSN